jgi:hypothetical protein
MSSLNLGNATPRVLMRTKPVSPSRLGAFVLCPLRYLFETENQGMRLAPSPAALRGNSVHAIVRDLAGRSLPQGAEIRSAFIRHMTEQLNQLGTGTPVRIAFETGGLRGVLTTEQTVTACQFIRSVLSNYSIALPRQSNGSLVRSRPSFLGRERKFEDLELDLEGRPDLVQQSPEGVIHIIDYKTGKVLMADGSPRTDYLTQLAAYGLLLQRATSRLPIILKLVGPTSSWSGSFTPAIEGTARELVRQVRVRLPKHQEIDLQAIAAPGAHCGACRQRMHCRSYAMALWRSEANEILKPSDTCGRVISIRWHDEFAEMVLRRPSGTPAAISGIPRLVAIGAEIGTRVAAYSLGTFDRTASAEFLTNFYMFRPDNPRSSAFESSLLLSPEMP